MTKITHAFAAVAAAVYAFFLTPAGTAVLHQYPKLAAGLAGLTTIAALYHNPSAASPKS